MTETVTREENQANGVLLQELVERCGLTGYATPPLLARMVDSGFLGKKSSCGFYSCERQDGNG